MNDEPRSIAAVGPADTEALTESELAQARAGASSSTGAFNPSVGVTADANASGPVGALDPKTPPQPATGHYGAGYGDPTTHYGNTFPAQATMAGPGQAAGAGTGGA